MAQIVVAPLGDVGVARTFGANPVATVRNQIVVHRVLVGIDLLPGITFGDTLPHHFARHGVALAKSERESLRRLKRPCQPYPDRLLLASHEGPYLIALDRIASRSG